MSERRDQNTINSEARFIRIESTMERMAIAIIDLARVEEKILSLEQRRAEHHERQNRIAQKLDVQHDAVIGLQNKMVLFQKMLFTFLGITVSMAGAAISLYIKHNQ
jgi:hypothetical protein